MTKVGVNGVCRTRCINCPLSNYNNGKNMLCTLLESQQPEIAVKIVQEWSDTHPKEKTYLSEFLRHYPNASLNSTGIPAWICPRHLGLKDIVGCKKCAHTCNECWNQTIG